MNFKFLLALLFGSIMTMTAQNPGSITGKIADKTTNEPLPYVSIVVKDNGAVVSGALQTITAFLP